MAERQLRTRKPRAATRKPDDATSSCLQELIEVLIKRCVDAIEAGELKLTIADIIRLRKLQRELYPTRAVVPEVTWIDGWEQAGWDQAGRTSPDKPES